MKQSGPSPVCLSAVRLTSNGQDTCRRHEGADSAVICEQCVSWRCKKEDKESLFDEMYSTPGSRQTCTRDGMCPVDLRLGLMLGLIRPPRVLLALRVTLWGPII
mmetsp:Transcript_17758/g.21295  ORF Transcript_17758/g.21295 Transcript_17758/m.21295 type:complete len:104 (+) Transcript_17758:276-587(+)